MQGGPRDPPRERTRYFGLDPVRDPVGVLSRVGYLSEDNDLPGVAPHHFFGRVRFVPSSLLSIEVEDEYTAEFFANDANTARNSAANVVDARVQFAVRVGGVAVRPFLGVNNLLDRTYNSSVVVNQVANRFYEPAPGRNFYVGTALRFGGW